MIYKYILKIKVSNITYTYNLGSLPYSENNVDYPALHLINGADTSVRTALCTSSYKSATGEAEIALVSNRNLTAYSDIVQKLLDAKAQGNKYHTSISVYDQNGIKLFFGYLDEPSFTISSGKIPDNFSIAFRDITTVLDQKYKQNVFYENKTLNYVVGQLISSAFSQTSGVAPISVATTDIPEANKVSNWVMTEDDGSTFRDRIDTLLFEAPGCVLWYDPQNDCFRIKQLPTSEPETDNLRQVHFLIDSKLVTQTGVSENDGILLKYPTVSERENQNVFAGDIKLEVEEQTGRLLGQTIAPNTHYPENGDVEATYQEFSAQGLDRAYISGESRVKNSDISLMYVKNATLQTTPGVDITGSDLGVETTPISSIGWTGQIQYYPRKAWVLLKNKSTTRDINLTLFSITGTAIYKSKINKLTVPQACTNPQEYEAETIFANDSAKANAFASWLFNVNKYSKTTSVWYESADRVSADNPFSTLGEVVNVIHSDTGVLIPHIVVKVEDVAHTMYGRVRKHKVTAISLAGYKAYTPKKSTVQPSSSETGKQIVSTSYFYAVTQTQTAPDPSTITSPELLPLTTTNKYLWQKELIVYTDGSIKTTVVLVGTYGEKGEQGSQGIPGTSGVGTKYFGARSWTQAQVDSFTQDGYTDSWMQTLTGGVETKTGDSIYLVITNTTTNQKGVLYLFVTSGASASAQPTAKVVGYVKDGANGQPGTPAFVFSIEASSQTYLRNRRLNGNQTPIAVTVNQQGYTGTPVITANHGTFQNGQLVIPYVNDYDTITITATIQNVITTSLTLNVIDETGDPMFFGGSTSSVPTSSVGNFIENDYFVYYGTTTSTRIKGTTYEFDGSAWISMEVSTANGSKLLNSLQALKANNVSFADISDANSVSWFASIIAEQVIAERVFANIITMGKQGIIQSENIDDSKVGQDGYLTEAGFRLESDNGIVRANGGYFKNISMQNADIDGNLQSEYLDTVIRSSSSVKISALLDTARSGVTRETFFSQKDFYHNVAASLGVGTHTVDFIDCSFLDSSGTRQRKTTNKQTIIDVRSGTGYISYTAGVLGSNPTLVLYENIQNDGFFSNNSEQSAIGYNFNSVLNATKYNTFDSVEFAKFNFLNLNQRYECMYYANGVKATLYNNANSPLNINWSATRTYPVYITRTSTGITVQYRDNSFTLTVGDYVSWYGFNLISDVVKEGIQTGNIYKKGSSANVGEATKPYDYGYFGTVVGNVNSAGTSNEVYGAVFN